MISLIKESEVFLPVFVPPVYSFEYKPLDRTVEKCEENVVLFSMITEVLKCNNKKVVHIMLILWRTTSKPARAKILKLSKPLCKLQMSEPWLKGQGVGDQIMYLSF